MTMDQIMLNQIILLFSVMIGFAFGIYGLLLYKEVKGSTLAKIILNISISISIFAIHHLFDIFEPITIKYSLLKILSGTFEIGGSLFLLLAAYNLCKISHEIFVSEEYPIKKRNKK